MNTLIATDIPRTELKEFKDYIGFLFKNENGVFNICDNEEDIQKSNQWFKNFPLNTVIISQKNIEKGDKFLAQCANRDLNNKIFTYVGIANEREAWKECTKEIILIEGEDGTVHLTTEFLLNGAYHFVRNANRDDLKKVVIKQTLDVVVE
jgi:hypothetical protein